MSSQETQPTSAADVDDGRRQAVAQRLKARRLEKGLSINELARQAGVAKSNLARLEAGDGNPSLETLWALSDALGINVREMIEPQAAGLRLVPAPQGTDFQQGLDAQAEAARFGVTLLSTCPAGAMRDLYRAAFEPGPARLSEPHAEGTVEHVILLSGKARVGPVGTAKILGPGDYVTFAANTQHIYEALEAGTTAIVVMEYR
ncbi:helix-turn-helix domain-containing protein [Pelagibius sp.]|uniref:helix-turn-helix domain-containing protein n=1 Tax=Pelagibius sp. TaxID=1931238 RepID=UPI002603028A|nr:XRE family transcriptional regulator [Pelagibius sp.]